MPKYQIEAHMNDYQRYVIEESDEDTAWDAAYRAFRMFLSDKLLVVDLEVEEVPEDTPLGDN